MTHFPVIVCTDNPADIEARLAPFDENTGYCQDCQDGNDCKQDPECGNSNARWDWWSTGGRWGGYFPYRPEHAGAVIMPEKGWSSPEIRPGWCDGGPKYALDLDKLRDDDADRARGIYAEWAALVKDTPDALPWSTFTENISAGNGYTIEQAREEYGSQPRIKALQASDRFRFMMSDPVEEFQIPEDLYVERARAAAVPGWAVLTLDGRWMEAGNMGWWAMSDATESSKIGYLEASNAYVESLPDETFLVCVDCHILRLCGGGIMAYLCESYCAHGGRCESRPGHDGDHDSGYCTWSDAEAVTREQADRALGRTQQGRDFLESGQPLADAIEYGFDDD